MPYERIDSLLEAACFPKAMSRLQRDTPQATSPLHPTPTLSWSALTNDPVTLLLELQSNLYQRTHIKLSPLLYGRGHIFRVSNSGRCVKAAQEEVENNLRSIFLLMNTLPCHSFVSLVN